IACSSGIVTADSTVCALAPMYTLVTTTWGGARSGNCAIGRLGIEIAPPKIMNRAHTVANTGRSMKKSTKLPPDPGALPCIWDGFVVPMSVVEAVVEAVL